jgi:hypothetical protein
VARRGPREWPRLLIASGLAALIGALGGFASEFVRTVQGGATDTCEIAAGFLQDESPSPYIDPQTRQRVTQSAARRFERCMED